MSEIKARLDKVHIMTDRDSAQFDSYELETIRHTVFHARNHIANLESTIRNHEEDSAALPEDMSITETIKMKDKRIDTLIRDLAINKRALEILCKEERDMCVENETNKDCPFPDDSPNPNYDNDCEHGWNGERWKCWVKYYIQQATAEIDKESAK